MDKAPIRRRMLQWRWDVPVETAANTARAISDSLLHLIDSPASVIAGYAAIRGEIDIFPALRALARRGHAIALPCIEEPGVPLTFRRYDPDRPLEEGTYGIECPADGEKLIPTLVLVPVLAFDSARQRLGYGGGYYDRTLADLNRANPAIKAYGIAYAAQQVEALPAEPHDMPLDAIVTENGIIR